VLPRAEAIRRACFFCSGRYRLDPDTLVEMFTNRFRVTPGAVTMRVACTHGDNLRASDRRIVR
jgi:hypothetical protein